MIGFVRGLTNGHTGKQTFASRRNKPFYRCYPKLQSIFTDWFIMLNFLVYLKSFAKSGFLTSREAYPKRQSILCQGPAYGQFGQPYFEILRRIFVSEYTTSRLSFFLVRRAKRARQKNDHTRDRRGAKFRKTLKIAILYDIGIKVYCLVWRILKQ